MRKDVLIYVNPTNGFITKDQSVVGMSGENLQGRIIFTFPYGKFIDGVAWLEFERETEKGYLLMDKVENTYQLEILSSLLNETGRINFQLRITEEKDGKTPIFKSNIFYLEVKESINATSTIEDDYPNLIDVVNTKIGVDNIKAGKNISIEQNGMDLTINANDEDTKDYDLLSNKPKINGVELTGNLTAKDLGIDTYDDTEIKAELNLKANKSDIPDTSNFITKNVDDLVNYTKTSDLSSVATSGSYNDLTDKPTIPTIPTNVSAFTNDANYITNSVSDLTNYYNKTYIDETVGNIENVLQTINSGSGV